MESPVFTLQLIAAYADFTRASGSIDHNALDKPGYAAALTDIAKTGWIRLTFCPL